MNPAAATVVKTETKQSWPGQISDSMCGATHRKRDFATGLKLSDRECTMFCVKDGAQYVFVDNGHIYKIDNQDFAGLPEHAGHSADVSGVLTGDSLHITTIDMPAHVAEVVVPE